MCEDATCPAKVIALLYYLTVLALYKVVSVVIINIIFMPVGIYVYVVGYLSSGDRIWVCTKLLSYSLHH